MGRLRSLYKWDDVRGVVELSVCSEASSGDTGVGCGGEVRNWRCTEQMLIGCDGELVRTGEVVYGSVPVREIVECSVCGRRHSVMSCGIFV
jgi:hypothetical protein